MVQGVFLLPAPGKGWLFCFVSPDRCAVSSLTYAKQPALARGL